MNCAVAVLLIALLESIFCLASSALNPTNVNPAPRLSRQTLLPTDMNGTRADPETISLPEVEARTSYGHHNHSFFHSNNNAHHFHSHGLLYHNYNRRNITALTQAASVHLSRFSNATNHLLWHSFPFIFYGNTHAHGAHNNSHSHRGHHRVHPDIRRTLPALLSNRTNPVACNRTAFSLDVLGLPVTLPDDNNTIDVLNCVRLRDPTSEILVLGQVSAFNPGQLIANATRSLELLENSTNERSNETFLIVAFRTRQPELDHLHKNDHHHHEHGHLHQARHHDAQGNHVPHNVTFSDVLKAFVKFSTRVIEVNNAYKQDGVLGVVENLVTPRAKAPIPPITVTKVKPNQSIIHGPLYGTKCSDYVILNLTMYMPSILAQFSEQGESLNGAGNLNATSQQPFSLLLNVTDFEQL